MAGATNLPVMGVWLTEEGESPCRPDQERCIFQTQVSIDFFAALINTFQPQVSNLFSLKVRWQTATLFILISINRYSY